MCVIVIMYVCDCVCKSDKQLWWGEWSWWEGLGEWSQSVIFLCLVVL